MFGGVCMQVVSVSEYVACICMSVSCVYLALFTVGPVWVCVRSTTVQTPNSFKAARIPPSALFKTPPVNNSLTNLPPSPPTPDLFSNLWQLLICSSFLKYSHFQMSHKGSRQFPFLSDRCPEVHLLGESPSHITRFLENCCPLSQSSSSIRQAQKCT